MKSKVIDCEAFYLDWFNNYLTVEKIAEHYGIETTRAYILINYGRQKHYGAKNHLPAFKAMQESRRAEANQ